MTKRTDDQIPVIPPRGASPTFPARQPERTVTEDAVLQHENIKHQFISGTMTDGTVTRRLINVFRSSITDPVTNLFKRGVDNLDDVLDSSSYGRTVLSYLSGGKIVKLLRSAIDEPAANFFKRGTDTLNDVLDSSSYARIVASYLSVGKLITVLRSGVDEPVGNLFKRNVDTLDNVLDSTTYGRLIVAYLSLGKLIKVLRSGTDESVDNLFKRNVNTIDEVLDGTSFKRVKSGAFDVGGNLNIGSGTGVSGYGMDNIPDGTTFRKPKAGALDVGGNIDLGGTAWVNKIVDNISDGVTYGKTVLSYLSSGKIFRVLRGGVDEVPDNLFKKSVDTADSVARGSTFGIPKVGATDGSGNIDLSGSAWINKATDFLSDGVMSRRQLQHSGGDNLAENGNFEAPGAAGVVVPGYTASNATISLDTVSPYAGTKSLKVVSAGIFGGAISVAKWKVSPGEVYKVQAAMKCATGSDFADPQLQFLDGNGSYLTGIQPGITSLTWIVQSGTGVVPAGAAYAQLSLQNNNSVSGTVWFDDVQVFRVRQAKDEVIRGNGDTTFLSTIIQNVDNGGNAKGVMQINGRSAGVLSRANNGHAFFEEFGTAPDDWNLRNGTRNYSLVQGDGYTGANALRLVGYQWLASPYNIPYDYNKLYRMRLRIRLISAPSNGQNQIYCGVEGVAADGSTLVNTSGGNSSSSQHYVCCAAITVPPGSAYTDYTGWFAFTAGAGGSSGSTDPGAPQPLQSNVKFIRPLLIIGYNGAGNDGIWEVDLISIDVFDEVGHKYLYDGLDGSGVRDGKLIRSRSWNDGSFGYVASTNDGLTANVGCKAQNAVLLNNHFQKNVDTLDAIVDGGTYKRIAGVSAAGHITDTSVAPNVGLGLFDNGSKSANFTLDWNNGNIQKVTLGASSLTITLSNPAAGRIYTVIFVQDATGGRTMPTCSPALDFGDAGSPSSLWNLGANKKNVVSMLYDGTSYISLNSGTGY